MVTNCAVRLGTSRVTASIELRPSYQGVPYRILYFFVGKDLVVLSHGITKEDKVPDVEIERAVERKKRFEADPKAQTYKPGKWTTE
jgi:hypothetical protein